MSGSRTISILVEIGSLIGDDGAYADVAGNSSTHLALHESKEDQAADEVVRVEGHVEENLVAVEAHESQSHIRDEVQVEDGTNFMGNESNSMHKNHGDRVHTDLQPQQEDLEKDNPVQNDIEEDPVDEDPEEKDLVEEDLVEEDPVKDDPEEAVLDEAFGHNEVDTG